MRSTSSWRRWRATVRYAPAIAFPRRRQARFSSLSIKSISRGTARTGAPSSRGSGGTSWSAKLGGGDIDLADAEIAVVVGPTASGKSDLALALAEARGGEIIGADSVQVYRHFDVGSSKPTREERALVPNHLVDVVDPNEPFDAA